MAKQTTNSYSPKNKASKGKAKKKLNKKEKLSTKPYNKQGR